MATTKEKTLAELRAYLNIDYGCGKVLGISSRVVVKGVLERTVEAIKAGVTPEELKQLFIEYLPEYQPDRAAG